MWLAKITRNKSSRGFTLIEITVTLVLLGFMGLSIGTGLVESMKLYRISKTTDLVLPQIDAAYNVIFTALKNDRGDSIQKSGDSLTFEGKKILGNVKSYKCDARSAYGNSSAKVQHVSIELDFDFTEDPRTLQFDVYTE